MITTPSRQKKSQFIDMIPVNNDLEAAAEILCRELEGEASNNHDLLKAMLFFICCLSARLNELLGKPPGNTQMMQTLRL